MSDDQPKEYDGVVGWAVKVEAEKDESVIMTIPVVEMKVGPNDRDHASLLLVAQIFKHILMPHFSPHSLDLENLYLQIEVPKDMLRPEWRIWLEDLKKEGARYHLSDEKINENDPTRWVPKVIEKTPDDENE